jgi:hypothetical protein
MKPKLFLITIFVISILVSDYGISQHFWEERPSGVSVSLNSAFDVNAEIAYVCGDSGTVLKSTNYGYVWFKASGNIPDSIKLVHISCSGTNIVLVSGFKDSVAYVYRTSNGGANWSLVFSQQKGFVNAFHLVRNSAYGFMLGNPVGGRWSLWKSTDSGANWDSAGMFLPQFGSEKGFPNCIWGDSLSIRFGTNSSRIYSRKGYNSPWTVITVPIVNVRSVWFNSYNLKEGLAGGEAMIRTLDSGYTWSIVTVPGTGNINSISGTMPFFNFVCYTRTNNTIYASYNGGTSWQTQYTAPSGNYNHIHFMSGIYYFGGGSGLAVRTNGGISRANSFVEGVRIISSEIPEDCRLYQNYPNPFNSSTKIKFDTRKLLSSGVGEVKGGIVKLTIYDILGKEVEVLTNKVIQPGTYEATWYTLNIPSGIYFCRMLVTDPVSLDAVYDKVIKLSLIK